MGENLDSILIIVILVLAYLVGKHWSLFPARGTELKGQKEYPSISGSLTIGTYNIHRARGLDGKRDLNRIAKVITGCDVVALQEVEGFGVRHFGNQAYKLGQDCGYAVHFSPTRRHFGFPHRGNALLTRAPVTNWLREPLSPTTGKAYRNLTVYELSLEGKTLHIINTHLSKLSEQIAPIKRVFEIFLSLERAILVGDFNAHTSHPEVH